MCVFGWGAGGGGEEDPPCFLQTTTNTIAADNAGRKTPSPATQRPVGTTCKLGDGLHSRKPVRSVYSEASFRETTAFEPWTVSHGREEIGAIYGKAITKVLSEV